MFTGLLESQSASNLKLAEDAGSRFDGEVVRQGLGDGVWTRSAKRRS